MKRALSAVAVVCALALTASTADARPRHHKRMGGHSRSVSLAGVVSSELVSKVREIMDACGSVAVSARAGRGYRSNHPIGRAVDLRGNPSCIYAHLRGWPGGYSTDYASAPGGPHVHISYNPHGQEWGVRFVHNHGRHRHPHAYAGRATFVDRNGAF